MASIGRIAGVVVAGAAAWWWWSAPPAHHRVGPAVEIGEVPAAVREVLSSEDVIARWGERLAPGLPPIDEVIPFEDEGFVLVSATDGWIWRVDLESGAAERFADPPLMPAGARRVPGRPDEVVVCAAHLDEVDPTTTERAGLYRLRLSSRQFEPVVLDVPESEPLVGAGRVFRRGTGPRATIGDSTSTRPVAFCNDVDVSADGRRMYFSEPFAYPGAAMGRGAFPEAITLGENGRLWSIDLAAGTVELAAAGFPFLDGVLVEPRRGAEHSVLVTETARFRIRRLWLDGPNAGSTEVLWDALPGMPDGMDRDASGRIWIGFVRDRSPLVTWVHQNPWVKPLLLRLPSALLPAPTGTGLMALSPDASTPLLASRHDGSVAREISVVVPGDGVLYLPTFGHESRGLVRMRVPLDG